MRRLVCLVLLLVAVPAAQGQVVSVNFDTGNATAPGGAGPFPLNPSDVAGVVPAANWNNVASVNGTTNNLLNSTGAMTSVSLSVTGSFNPWSISTPNTPNGVMMRGYLDTFGATIADATTTQLTFSNVNTAITIPYEVIVYFDGQNDSASRIGRFVLSGATTGNRTIYGRDAPNSDFSGTFTQVPSTSTTDQVTSTPAGNYIVFQNVTGSSFTISATGVSSSDAIVRAPINAIQIAGVPEPTTLALAGWVGCVAAYAGWRRWRATPEEPPPAEA